MEDRKLYKGEFNLSGEKHEEYVRAYSEEQAFRLLCTRLGALTGKTGSSVQIFFKNRPNSYDIEEVKEC